MGRKFLGSARKQLTTCHLFPVFTPIMNAQRSSVYPRSRPHSLLHTSPTTKSQEDGHNGVNCEAVLSDIFDLVRLDHKNYGGTAQFMLHQPAGIGSISVFSVI